MMGMLPEDDTHPPRPDLPVLRHLTFTEVHAIELGIYVGLLMGWGVILGESESMLFFGIYLVRTVTSRQKVERHKTKANHGVGIHDALIEPHYFGGAVVVSMLLVVGAGELHATLLLLPAFVHPPL